MAEEDKDKFSYLNQGVFCAYPDDSGTARLYEVTSNGARLFFHLDERQGKGFIEYGDPRGKQRSGVGVVRMDRNDGKPKVILNLPRDMTFEGKRLSPLAILGNREPIAAQEALEARPVEDMDSVPADLVRGSGGFYLSRRDVARLPACFL